MADTHDTPITFIASIAPLQSAIQITGDGNGVRVKLDIPETEMLNALSLLAMRETSFKVTIEPITNERQSKQNPRKSPY